MLRKNTLFLLAASVLAAILASGCNYLGQPLYLAEAHHQEEVAEAERTNEEETEYEVGLHNGQTPYNTYEDEAAIEYIAFAEYASYSLAYAIVARVIDGDTIELECGERVRFIGIDTPEIGEPGANEATQFVREHVYGQQVWLEADGNDRDRFGRLRRYIWLSYPTDTQDEEQIMAYQLNALLLIHGLADIMILGSPRNEALFGRIIAEAARDYIYETASSPLFIGNRNSQIFHTMTCSTLPAERNRIYFATRDEAIAAGHRACNRCAP